jgi:hypothetical protein
LEIGVPWAGIDRRQAARAWEIAVRLREQAARFHVECDIDETFPESALALKRLEQGIQTTARRLAVATNICATSLDGLIDALERYNNGRADLSLVGCMDGPDSVWKASAAQAIFENV